MAPGLRKRTRAPNDGVPPGAAQAVAAGGVNMGGTDDVEQPAKRGRSGAEHGAEREGQASQGDSGKLS
jgi:hypothetical protein